MQDRNNNIDNVVPLSPFDSEWAKDVAYSFADLVIKIEYLAGDVRTKVTGSGLVMAGMMPAAYGYILRTTDAHGEEIDMYLAPMASADALVYVIDQVDPDTGAFDEHKVMFGFSSMEEAAHTYCSVFGDGTGQDRLGAITIFSKEDFITWLSTDGAALRPASFYKADGVISKAGSGVTVGKRPCQEKPRDEAGGVIVELTDFKEGPKIKIVSNDAGSFEYHLYLYSALKVETWSNVIDTLCRVLDLATDKDMVHIHIASPGGYVSLMGRVISAINRTKAKVITYAEGCVASAATAIWASGHERHICPGAYFMQHMSSQLLLGKTTDIAAKSVFAVKYIETRLNHLVDIGLFTQEEINDMVDKSADVYISGREAVNRVGKISTRLITQE